MDLNGLIIMTAALAGLSGVVVGWLAKALFDAARGYGE